MSTFRDFLNRLAEMEGRQFSGWSEDEKMVRVSHVNAALRWAWRTEDPLFAFPFTVDSGTVAVTSGLIAPTLLGDGSWCSLWEADPRPAGTALQPVAAHVSHEGVHPVKSLSSVFAFYRAAVPQGTYVAAGEYATPTGIPAELLDMVTLRALYAHFTSAQDWGAVNALAKSYGDPGRDRGYLTEALRNTGLVWEGNALALTGAAP